MDCAAYAIGRWVSSPPFIKVIHGSVVAKSRAVEGTFKGTDFMGTSGSIPCNVIKQLYG